ncbi:MAG: mechanosensitive ion channel family protein [Acidobacteria bacterium]|nr:MAG: mechanosensitive ion channel family protein [Acidobacteriota bacterium]
MPVNPTDISFRRPGVDPFRGLVTAACLLAAVLPAAAGVTPLDLSSPRATMRTFLDAVNDAARGETDRLDDAAACFDLSGHPLMGRAAARRLARDLKTYLDKTELVDLARIPERPEGDRYLYRLVAEGEISFVRMEDGRWLFSPETVSSVPSLLASVKDKPFVAGLSGAGPANAFADWVRARLPRSFLRTGFLLENWQWLGLVLLAILGVLADRLSRLLLARILDRWLGEAGARVGLDIRSGFVIPLGVLVMALVWSAGLPLLDLPANVLAALAFAATLVIAVAGVWAAYRLVDVIAAYLAEKARGTASRVDDLLVPLFRRALKIAVIAFGIVFVASNLNVNVTSLLAGLGIGGIALAMAAKDTVENLFGSVTVLIDRPFQIGDWIRIGDYEGTVEDLGFRSTRIRTFYNSLVTVPNSQLVRATVDNMGARRYRRYKTLVSVEYGTPPEKIEAFCEGIRELIRRHPYTRKDYYMVYLNDFAASSLDILLYVFFQTPDWATELRERHRLLVDIIRLAERIGVGFAFPTRTVHVASVPGGLVPRQEEASSGAAEPQPQPAADPVRAGREAAREVAGRLGEPPPVDFGDPDRLAPGAP